MLLLLAVLLLQTFAVCGKDPELVVFTVATEETDGLRRLLKSAHEFDYKVKVLGLGEEWKGGDTRIGEGGGQKIRLLKEGLKEYKSRDDAIILFVDA
ncbi:unnamed protein product [Strongylus vulgaris]|uniref:PLOD1-3-like GT domain-containing protein n=1 Tax=Strongylus vulgaris TaxID=40348 RepID=A0A3P7J4P7_STRVU|nr:unnamed protein product [Strongylus vulgaris]